MTMLVSGRKKRRKRERQRGGKERREREMGRGGEEGRVGEGDVEGGRGGERRGEWEREVGREILDILFVVGYTELSKALRGVTMVTTGEHEHTR